MIEYRDELTRLAAECREAARWSRDFQRIAIVSREVLWGINSLIGVLDSDETDRLEKLRLALGRIASNIARACRLAASCPDLPRYYLLGAADELDAMAGAPAETTEESTE